MDFPAAVRWRHCSRIWKTRSRKSKWCPIGYCTWLNSVHEHGFCRRERHSYVTTHLYTLSTYLFTTIWPCFSNHVNRLFPHSPDCAAADTQIIRCLLSFLPTPATLMSNLYTAKLISQLKFKIKQNPPLYFTAMHWNATATFWRWRGYVFYMRIICASICQI